MSEKEKLKFASHTYKEINLYTYSWKWGGCKAERSLIVFEEIWVHNDFTTLFEANLSRGTESSTSACKEDKANCRGIHETVSETIGCYTYKWVNTATKSYFHLAIVFKKNFL